MIERYTYCVEHLNKIIFFSKEEAETFIKLNKAGLNYGVYHCPIPHENHYHIRNKTLRNSRHKIKRQEQRHS